MTRRGHNEGSIYKRSDVRWTGDVSVNGKRKFIYGKTRQEAPGKKNVYSGFLRLLASAGLLQVRLSDLRHTRATLLLSIRVNAKVVSVGYASVSITVNIYSHAIRGMQQDATAIMAAL